MRLLYVSSLVMLAGLHAIDRDCLCDKYGLDLQGITEVRVRSGGTCHRQRDEEKILAVETSSDAIRRLTDSFALKKTDDLIRCRCCGDPTIEFYRGQKLAFWVGLHHGTILRSEASGDVEMTQGGARRLHDWLVAHGVGR